LTAPGSYSHGGFPGSFFDGRTARARVVSVECDADGLRICQPDGVLLALWPAADVRLTARRHRDAALRLRCGVTDAARLTIADTAALATFEQHCPNLHRSPDRLRDQLRPLVFWGGGAVSAILFMVFFGVPWLAAVVAQAVPPEIEARWGEEVVEPTAGLISQFMGGGPKAVFCETPAGRAALDRLVARLTAGQDMAIPLTVRVLDAPKANAFTLPGGQILLVSGLFAEARDSGAVAGILAHEIGHAVERHPLESSFKSIGLATLLSLLVGDVTGGAFIVAGTQVLLETSYSRDAEREADGIAVDLLNDADITAAPTAAFFDRLAAEEGDASGAAALIDTPPPSHERADAIRAASTGQGLAMPAADWQALRTICDD